MKQNNSNFFWTSYTDLMTSLFFVMLALYVLTVAALRYQQKATEEQLKKIKEIQNATKSLPEKYFEYQSEYKRFTLKRQINFLSKDSTIPVSDHQYLIQVGQSIQKLIENLKVKYRGDNIKYLVIIEGMSSNITYSKNYQLSYDRALSLFRFWQDQNIQLDPEICEVMISGSGTGGVGRFSSKEEVRNQRFLIQIIPKIGRIEDLNP